MSVLKVQEAVMCKLLRCTPSELRKEDAKDVERLNFIFNKIGDKNPFFLL